MKTLSISKSKTTSELFYSFGVSYYPKELKNMDYAMANKNDKVVWFSGRDYEG